MSSRENSFDNQTNNSRRLRRLFAVEVLEQRLVPTVFTVTDFSGGTASGTLYDAIQMANADANPDADTINFNTSTTQTITLAQALPDITDPGGLTIDGAGLITVNGNGSAAAVRSVFSASSYVSTLTFRGLIITGGYQDDTLGTGVGAGISFNGAAPASRLVIDACTLTANSISLSSTATGGGAVYVTDAALQITGSTLSNNTVNGGNAYGGALYLDNQATTNNFTATISTSQFNDNIIVGDVSAIAGGGGAIFYNDHPAASDSLTIDSSSFARNSTDKVGGAVNAFGKTVSINNSRFQNNHANEGGGGVDYSNNAVTGGMTIESSVFEQNTTDITGGAIQTTGDVQYIRNTLFQGNHADDGGGAIDHAGGAINEISASLFRGNTSDLDAGAIINSGTITLIDSVTFTANRAGSTIGSGGAICNTGTITTLQNSTFEGNTAPATGGGNGGGAICTDGTIVNLRNNTFANNAAGDDGAALEVEAGGTVTNLFSNIFANSNLAMGGDVVVEVGGVIANSDFNLIQNPAGYSATVSGPNNIFSVNPQLGTLQNNGGNGLTLTMAIAPTSPALNTGSNPGGLTYDERGSGFPRTVGAGTDIGAFELQAGNFQLIDGVLFVYFTPNDDVGVFTQLAAHTILVNVNGVSYGPIDGVNRIVVEAMAGNDIIRLANKVTIPMAIDGSVGTDTLDFSFLVDELLTVIGSNPGTDSTFINIENILGSQGNDYVLFKSDATLDGFIDGEGGTNILDFSRMNFPVELLLPDGPGPGSLRIANFDYAIGPLFKTNNIRPASANITNKLGRNLFS